MTISSNSWLDRFTCIAQQPASALLQEREVRRMAAALQVRVSPYFRAGRQAPASAEPESEAPPK